VGVFRERGTECIEKFVDPAGLRVGGTRSGGSSRWAIELRSKRGEPRPPQRAAAVRRPTRRRPALPRTGPTSTVDRHQRRLGPTGPFEVDAGRRPRTATVTLWAGGGATATRYIASRRLTRARPKVDMSTGLPDFLPPSCWHERGRARRSSTPTCPSAPNGPAFGGYGGGGLVAATDAKRPPSQTSYPTMLRLAADPARTFLGYRQELGDEPSAWFPLPGERHPRRASTRWTSTVQARLDAPARQSRPKSAAVHLGSEAWNDPKPELARRKVMRPSAPKRGTSRGATAKHQAEGTAQRLGGRKAFGDDRRTQFRCRPRRTSPAPCRPTTMSDREQRRRPPRLPRLLGATIWNGRLGPRSSSRGSGKGADPGDDGQAVSYNRGRQARSRAPSNGSGGVRVRPRVPGAQPLAHGGPSAAVRPARRHRAPSASCSSDTSSPFLPPRPPTRWTWMLKGADWPARPDRALCGAPCARRVPSILAA